MPSIVDHFESPEIGISTAKDAKSAKENGFTAENEEIAEKKWVPNSGQQGYLSSAPSAISAVNFLSFAFFASFAVKFGSAFG
jgi:hypothetical protein